MLKVNHIECSQPDSYLIIYMYIQLEASSKVDLFSFDDLADRKLRKKNHVKDIKFLEYRLNCEEGN